MYGLEIGTKVIFDRKESEIIDYIYYLDSEEIWGYKLANGEKCFWEDCKPIDA